MCGLAAWLRLHTPVGAWQGCSDLVLPEGTSDPAAFEAAAALLHRRGPDASGALDFSLPGVDVGGPAAAELYLRASVLHLRGSAVTPQPVELGEGGGRLLFNGEIYSVLGPPGSRSDNGSEADVGADGCCGGSASSSSALWPPPVSWGLGPSGALPAGASDTQWLAERLAECEAASPDASWEHFAARLRDLLELVHGPFALAVWSPRRRALFFGRDKLGRRSLVVARSASGDVCVSSVAANPVDLWSELPVTGLFALDLADLSNPSVRHMPWREAMHFEQPWWWSATSPCPSLLQDGGASAAFARVLAAAVAIRVAGVAGGEVLGGSSRVGLLFSGGLDSTVLAALAAEALPDGETVELLNVAFDRAAPDRLTALCSFGDLVARYGAQRFRLVLADVEEAEVRRNEASICRLLGPGATHLDFNIAAALWFAARGEGLVCSTSFLQEAWWREVSTDPANLAGVCLDEQPRQARPPKVEVPPGGRPKCRSCVLPSKPGCAHECCKMCCRKAQERLGPSVDRCPVHKPRPVLKADADEGDEEPPETIPLDLSAVRLHGDSGGGGNSTCSSSVREEANPPKMRAGSRVLLVGTGADEFLGGYSRHRTARARRGAEGVQSEMLKDLQRLWTRNLGRDDRVVADHGREARHPFLDDAVLRFVGALPIDLLAFGPGGEAKPSPDKWMLRELAAARGLVACARFKKRAIQFGTRIAKQSNIWHTGSNRQGKGTMVYRALEDGGQEES
mmetsp:Transcript_95529/g.274045  ORF Transcript_95529/g.274045 Transcript_95529/m.274045 type:complete len:739 (+) Transcript_95529:58-2274(+)